jgi:hypothetical protein
MISSSIPSGTTLDLSANSRTVVVGQRFCRFKYLIVSNVITLIAAPKSINVLEIEKLLIVIVTIGIPGSTYFSIEMVFDIRLARFQIT